MSMEVQLRRVRVTPDLSPEALIVIAGAFDAAWKELRADIGANGHAIAIARNDLAGIVLGLARVGPIEHVRLKDKAVIGYRVMNGDVEQQLAACGDAAALFAKAPRGEG